jgi:hypothetical protein
MRARWQAPRSNPCLGKRGDGLLRSARNDELRRLSTIAAFGVAQQTPVAETRSRIYSCRREHHMTNILTFFSTRTLLQIIFILGSTVAMKAWSLGLVFGG